MKIKAAMEQYQNYLKQQKVYRRRKDNTERRYFIWIRHLYYSSVYRRTRRNALPISPTDYLEDYVDLITSIEITAEKSYKCQCVLKVTNLKLIIELKNDGNSDPGVIE
jgi:hypothetical protein